MTSTPCTGVASRRILGPMHFRARRASLEHPLVGTPMLARGLVVVTSVASPLFVCGEAHGASAAAAAAEGDGHHAGHHQGERPDSDRSCECPALTATVPADVGYGPETVPDY